MKFILILFGALAISATAQTITEAEYFIDSDPGPGNGTSIPLTAGSISAIAVNVPTSVIAALPDGTHTLGCRFRDRDGDWSISRSYPFYKADPEPAAERTIARIDYQWFQNGTSVSPVNSLTPASPTTIVSFDQLAFLAGLLEGQTYQLVFTPFDNAGNQGFSVTEEILVQTTDTNGDGIPDQWAIQNGFGINDTIADLQSDNDGLSNLEEFLAGTNPLLDDTDGDGMNDRAELDLALLGFDPLVSNTTAVTALRENAGNAGLYGREQLQALALNRPVLERNPATGKFTLTLGLQRSINLNLFTPFPFTTPDTSINGEGEIEFDFEAAEEVEFYSIEVQN